MQDKMAAGTFGRATNYGLDSPLSIYSLSYIPQTTLKTGLFHFSCYISMFNKYPLTWAWNIYVTLLLRDWLGGVYTARVWDYKVRTKLIPFDAAQISCHCAPATRFGALQRGK